MTSFATDPVALTAALVRCKSVTPEEGGALELLAGLLEAEGFRCQRIDRGEVPNLFARAGEAAPVLGFAGHTDVVPADAVGAWSVDPFGGEIRDGQVWGRGAEDMKSGIAAFVAAAVDARRQGEARGSVSLLITGDEEGVARNGTRAIVEWMHEHGESLDGCIVGEPTSEKEVGDTVKVGRRGSANFRIVAKGVAGHSAHPCRAHNPVTALARGIASLASLELDRGTGCFGPSTLTVTAIETGNPATNVIPATATAAVNVRFNDLHDPAGLRERIAATLDGAGADDGVGFRVEILDTSEAFTTAPGPFTELVREATREVTGREPASSTSGGTSDARFLRNLCPTVELGLVGRTLHQTDERVPVADIETLTRVYRSVIRRFGESVS